MDSPVRPEYILMWRMSPAPFSSPNALLYVGAAIKAVAANAPKMPRRDTIENVVSVILTFAPSLVVDHLFGGSIYLHVPRHRSLWHKPNLSPSQDCLRVAISRTIGKKLLKVADVTDLNPGLL